MPTALVVPPNSKMHTSFSWGVAQSEMIPIYHQFHRDYPGADGRSAAAQESIPRPIGPATPINSACIRFAGRGSTSRRGLPDVQPALRQIVADFLRREAK